MSLRKSALFVLLVATLVFIGCKPTEGSTNTPTDTTPVVNITDIKISKPSLTLTESFTAKLTATLEGEDVDTAPITWTVSGSAVSITDNTTTKTGENVTVKAEQKGKATVKASAGDKYVECVVTVNRALQIGDIIVQTFSPDGKPRGWKAVSYPDMCIISDKDWTNIIAVVAYIDSNGVPIGIGVKQMDSSPTAIGTKAWCIVAGDEYETDPVKKIRDVAATVPGTAGDTFNDTVANAVNADGYFANKTNGEQNFTEIKAVDAARTAANKIDSEYPAFGVVENYATKTDTRIKDNQKLKTGWYIPSMRELQGIFDNKETLLMYGGIEKAPQWSYKYMNPFAGSGYMYMILESPEPVLSSNQVSSKGDGTSNTKKQVYTLKMRDWTNTDGPEAKWHGEIVEVDKNEGSIAHVLPVRKFTDPD